MSRERRGEMERCMSGVLELSAVSLVHAKGFFTHLGLGFIYHYCISKVISILFLLSLLLILLSFCFPYQLGL